MVGGARAGTGEGWTATNHAAKSLRGIPGLGRSISLGSYIQSAYGTDAFALGFSALSGSYAMGRRPARPLATPPGNSLEHVVLDRDTVAAKYLGRNELKGFGTLPARPIGADVKEADWSSIFDGLVVIREERPPQPTPP